MQTLSGWVKDFDWASFSDDLGIQEREGTRRPPSTSSFMLRDLMQKKHRKLILEIEDL